MATELVYILEFIDRGVLSVDNGYTYLTELFNVIPRAIWPDKPGIGLDYAIARGFGGNDNDTGVYATISHGMIGQGVLNFGWLFGSIAVGILLSLWTAFLSRLRSQPEPLRQFLFMIGVGLTFNLGRDITLLVLWPIVFAYLAVRVLERSHLALTVHPKRQTSG